MLKAVSRLNAAIDELLTVDKYRSLIGFLEHVRGVLFLRGDKMYGLYNPLGIDRPPGEKVPCNDLMEKQMRRWIQRLHVQAGSSVLFVDAFLSGKRMPSNTPNKPARVIGVFSDAAKEGTRQPGLGGWICGAVWQYRLNIEELQLHITVLEAVAAVANIMAAHDLLGGTESLPPAVCFEAQVDALSTAEVLIKGRARSPMMQLVHSQALLSPQFRAMLPFLRVRHILGLGNIAADAASRGYQQVLEVVAKALGVRLRQIPAPQCISGMLAACLAQDCSANSLKRKRNEAQSSRARRKHEHCWGSRGKRFGDASHPGPQHLKFLPHSKRRRSNYASACPDPVGKPSQLTSFVPRKRRKSSPGQHSLQALTTPIVPSVHSSRPRPAPVTAPALAATLWADRSEYALCPNN